MIDHLDDLDADFRRFYRIDGIGEQQFAGLSGPRFLALAWRVAAYGGVLTALLQQQQEQGRTRPGVHVPPKWRGSDVEEVEATPTNLRTNPALAGVIEM